MPDRVSRRAAGWATLAALPVAVLVGVLAFAGLGGFDGDGAETPTPSATPTPASTAPVEMAAPRLAERPATVCRALLARLPDRLRDLPRRAVSAGPEQNAAYGDPAVTVACGVPPAEYGLTETLWNFDGVCWKLDETSDAAVFTTVDREVPVRVVVPAAYPQAAQWTINFSAPVVNSILSAEKIPSGCRR